MITVSVTSVMVDDQAKAETFYTDVLGFQTKLDIPIDDVRWLTVVSPSDPDGVQVVLEPDGNTMIQIDGQPAAQVFKRTLYEAGIPWTMFSTDDIWAEYQRLQEKGVRFTMAPIDVPGAKVATFDDTCGNLTMLQQMTGE